jgi:hypothetical protein
MNEVKTAAWTHLDLFLKELRLWARLCGGNFKEEIQQEGAAPPEPLPDVTQFYIDGFFKILRTTAKWKGTKEIPIKAIPTNGLLHLLSIGPAFSPSNIPTREDLSLLSECLSGKIYKVGYRADLPGEPYGPVEGDPLGIAAQHLIRYLNITHKSEKPLHRICGWEDCDNLFRPGQGGDRYCKTVECRKKQKGRDNVIRARHERAKLNNPKLPWPGIAKARLEYEKDPDFLLPKKLARKKS